jgi:hypothetical protein
MGREKLTFSEAWKRYWKFLVPLFVFVVLVIGGAEIQIIPFYALIPVFVVTVLLALWPYWFLRAPFTFGLLVPAVWVIGLVIGVGVLFAVAAMISLSSR